MKKCPHCAEDIQDEAVYCRFCSRELSKRPARLYWLALILVLLAGMAVPVLAVSVLFLASPEPKRENISMLFRDLLGSKRRETPTVKPVVLSPGDLIFSDDFSDPNSGWEIYSNETADVSFVNNQFQISIFSPREMALPTRFSSLKDATIEINSMITNPTNFGVSGISCRVGELGRYDFLFYEDGGYLINLSVPGKPYKTLAEGRLPAEWAPTKLQHLFASCDEDRLSIGLNGRILETVTDSELAIGDIGLVAGAWDRTPFIVVFDDLTVTVPDPEQ